MNYCCKYATKKEGTCLPNPQTVHNMNIHRVIHVELFLHKFLEISAVALVVLLFNLCNVEI